MTAALAAAKAPDIDWAGLSPLLALLGGAVVVLLVGLLGSRFVRAQVVPALSIVSFGAAIVCAAWQWDERASLIEGALRLDPLTLIATLIVCVAGIATTLLAWRDAATREVAHGEFFALLLTSAAGMVVLAAADNLVSAFVGLELLSLPLYILCAALLRSERSLESGLKYLIIGSVGSATLLYGFALLYGATGTTDYAKIGARLVSKGLAGDVLVLTGVGMTIVGLAFKASMAPFHQWTPDVYEGAPTPVTAFMSVATKIAAFAVIIRLFQTALVPVVDDWRPVWIAIAVISILIGNVGALGQSSVKRMLAFSSIAQAGYILVGVVVVTELGIQAVLFYAAVYLLANMAAFAVVTLRERETTEGDDVAALRGLAAERPAAAVAMTLAMLSLAGIPATAGFIGKFRLIEAAADGGYTWLGIVIVIGSMISLAYYLPVVAAMWRDEARPAPVAPGVDPVTGRAALAGGAPDADAPGAATGGWETRFVAVVMGAAILVVGIIPQPLFDLVEDGAQGIIPGPLITAATALGRALGLL
ncbi:MAG TPA: NADH-quinone oxidoreductase subunit N [Solirubrobacteraceae bacterium]|nr:NADH-quinone oxidoreductase subunit N [Solirubrobacteraceae bacterium]